MLSVQLNPLTGSFARRMLGAAFLDAATYEEVEADRGATTQALLIVVLAGVAIALAAGSPILASAAMLAWASWALVTFEVGARLMPQPDTRADVGELLRTLGFAATPGLLFAAAVVPFLAVPVTLVAAIWMLASMIVAVRQALDYTNTARAIMVCVVGWVLSLALVLIFGAWWGSTAS